MSIGDEVEVVFGEDGLNLASIEGDKKEIWLFEVPVEVSFNIIYNKISTIFIIIQFKLSSKVDNISEILTIILLVAI